MGNLTYSGATTVASELDANKIATINEMSQILDSMIAGSLPISTTGGTTTLSGTPATPQSQNMFLNITGTLTSNAIVEIPVAAGTGRNRIYIVKNGTTGAFTVTVRAVGGSGVIIAQGGTEFVYYNNTDIDLVFGSWQSWTPAWTNLTVGNGTVVAKYRTIGKFVTARLSLVLGSSSSVSGNITFSLPLTRVTYGGSAFVTPVGNARFYDLSATTAVEARVYSPTTTTGEIQALGASGTYVGAVAASSSVPFTWATSDEIGAEFQYEAA